jgi:hypothetical protein
MARLAGRCVGLARSGWAWRCGASLIRSQQCKARLAGRGRARCGIADRSTALRGWHGADGVSLFLRDGAWPGESWLGTAKHGTAGLGKAGRDQPGIGKARLGVGSLSCVQIGVAWPCWARQGRHGFDGHGGLSPCRALALRGLAGTVRRRYARQCRSVRRMAHHGAAGMEWIGMASRDKAGHSPARRGWIGAMRQGLARRW